MVPGKDLAKPCAQGTILAAPSTAAALNCDILTTPRPRTADDALPVAGVTAKDKSTIANDATSPATAVAANGTSAEAARGRADVAWEARELAVPAATATSGGRAQRDEKLSSEISDIAKAMGLAETARSAAAVEIDSVCVCVWVCGGGGGGGGGVSGECVCIFVCVYLSV